MEKQKKIKLFLIIALWMACLFDLFTFLGGNLFQFEVNPLYIFTKSILFLVIFKLVVNIGLSYVFWNQKPEKTFKWAYLFVLVILYATILQSIGGYTNLDVTTKYKETVGTPQEIQCSVFLDEV